MGGVRGVVDIGRPIIGHPRGSTNQPNGSDARRGLGSVGWVARMRVAGRHHPGIGRGRQEYPTCCRPQPTHAISPEAGQSQARVPQSSSSELSFASARSGRGLATHLCKARRRLKLRPPAFAVAPTTSGVPPLHRVTWKYDHFVWLPAFSVSAL
jgi:hypothetical protein